MGYKNNRFRFVAICAGFVVIIAIAIYLMISYSTVKLNPNKPVYLMASKDEPAEILPGNWYYVAIGEPQMILNLNDRKMCNHMKLDGARCMKGSEIIEEIPHISIIRDAS